MAKICVEAVMSVADLEHKDVNFDMIKVCALIIRNILTRKNEAESCCCFSFCSAAMHFCCTS